MSQVPRLYTPRLHLRGFTLADAPRLQELAGDKRVAATTLRIPHPYPDGAAEKWIETLDAAAEKHVHCFAITLAGTRTPGRENDRTDTGHLIGTIGLHPNSHDGAELGYWIGVPYWRKGFATEAAAAVIDFAFTRLKRHRVYAHHFANNPASGRVMQKLGLAFEGTLRQHVSKWGEYVDLHQYGILAAEWQPRKRRFAPFEHRESTRPIPALAPTAA